MTCPRATVCLQLSCPPSAWGGFVLSQSSPAPRMWLLGQTTSEGKSDLVPACLEPSGSFPGLWRATHTHLWDPQSPSRQGPCFAPPALPLGRSPPWTSAVRPSMTFRVRLDVTQGGLPLPNPPWLALLTVGSLLAAAGLGVSAGKEPGKLCRAASIRVPHIRVPCGD